MLLLLAVMVRPKCLSTQHFVSSSLCLALCRAFCMFYVFAEWMDGRDENEGADDDGKSQRVKRGAN